MSTSLPQQTPPALRAPGSKPNAAPKGPGRRIALVGGACLALVAIGFVAWRTWGSPARVQETVALFTVERGPLLISVTESGTVQNRNLETVKSDVEGRVTLIDIVAEGTMVKKGDFLVELDSSSLVDQKAQQAITVMNAEAAFIGARESLEVTKSQSESDIRKAELDALFADMDLDKYLKGDFPQNVRQAEADITIAKEDLQRAQDQLEWSKKLEQEKFITRIELQADELAAHKAELNLKLAEARLSLLQDYTYKRDVEQYKTNVVQTKAALDRVKRKATADIVQAEASLKAKEAEFSRQKDRLTKLDQQIAKCHIVAPVAGMVVYATTGKSSFRGNLDPLAKGQQIQERQELICLPTTASMMADVKIHESSLRKVQKDMPVRVTVDAVPGKVFAARVGTIGFLPDAQSMWMNPDLKLYETEVDIDGDAKDLRAGMSCKAEIIVASYADAVYVPVTAVVRVKGKTTVYIADGTKNGTPRVVEIGLDNNRMVHVVSGLKEGEKVLAAPPLGPSDAPIAEPEAPAKSAAGPAGGNGGDVSAAKGALPEGFDLAKYRAMSGDERRKFLDSLPPEQAAAVRKLTPRAPRNADKAGAQTPPAGAP